MTSKCKFVVLFYIIFCFFTSHFQFFYKVAKRADPTDIQVCGVSVTPSTGEEVLSLALSSSQLYSMSLSSSDLLKTEEAPLFDQLLGAGFHNGSVTGLDVCVRRPLVVTCGVDKTVRVWNYMERTVEV